MSKVKVIVPVDYDFSETLKRNVLSYDEVLVDEEQEEEYSRFQSIASEVFTVDDPHVIARKLRKLIEDSYFYDDIMNFFNKNQWILRFAYASDVASIMNDESFVISKKTVDFPKGCFIDSKTRKVFTRKIEIPVWRNAKVLKIKGFIEWLVMDDKNTLGEKIEASLLSNYDETRSLLINNLWLLMKVENKRRINIMRSINIAFSTVVMIVGIDVREDGSIEYVKESVAVPEEISLDYEQRNREIMMLLESSEGTYDERILKYYYDHIDSVNKENNNELICDNIWLLEHASSRTREIIFNGLCLSESRKTVKFRTVEKRRVENDIHSCMIDVDPEDLERYENLNKQLYTLILRRNPSQPLNEEEVAEFIKSDEDVLKLWPWLIDYVTNPVYIVEILESFKKEKKR